LYHLHLRIDGRLLIIASTGGGPRNPGWFDNLAKNPSVTVERGGETWEGRAVVLSGAERDALFAAVVKTTPTFGRYQERTQRTIPVVELLPAK
jgi:deazaflavin-dependent oxidoreductase (nitroreductase family)